ncbi:hypothetical protein R83H12_03023 [Fibrobacteria bacterium R8-3-H12]
MRTSWLCVRFFFCHFIRAERGSVKRPSVCGYVRRAELRQSCIARELVNRIQNRRKEMDLQITDRIRISVRCAADSVGAKNFSPLQSAIEKHRAYILEETQGVELFTGGEECGEWVRASVEGCEIEVAVGR